MDNGACSYRRFLNGDDSALAQIIAEYKDGLVLYINGYVKDIHTAEDLMVDTFFKIMVKKPLFFERYSFKTWLYTIARNLAIDFLRKSAKVSSVPSEELLSLSSSEEESLEKQIIRKERDLELHRALRELKWEYYDAIFLTYFAGLTNGETAKVMKKSTRQVEMLIYRGKKALKEKLCRGGFDYEEL